MACVVKVYPNHQTQTRQNITLHRVTQTIYGRFNAASSALGISFLRPLRSDAASGNFRERVYSW